MEKIISLVIISTYFVLAYLSHDIQILFMTLAGGGLSLGLIWFGDAIGSITLPVDLGLNFLNRTHQTPGSLVKLMGWIFLFFPFVILGIAYLVVAQ